MPQVFVCEDFRLGEEFASRLLVLRLADVDTLLVDLALAGPSCPVLLRICRALRLAAILDGWLLFPYHEGCIWIRLAEPLVDCFLRLLQISEGVLLLSNATTGEVPCLLTLLAFYVRRTSVP